jgi:hypothetical protein
MANDPTFLPPVLNAPLAARIDSLPRILAGPILRRVDARSVTVWVALRTPDLVGLQVIPTNNPTPVLTAGFTPPVKVGERLYVTAITASSLTPVLLQTVLYTYRLQFRPAGTTLTFDLRTPGYWIAGTPTPGALVDDVIALQFSYSGIGEPCFALPPDDHTQLRILHGSCRKIHGDSVDALATVDDYLKGLNNEAPPDAPAVNLAKRHHQLILSGDQIYADDVADIMLGMVTDAARTLIGVPELIPALGADGSNAETTRFGPTTREAKVTKEGGLTTHEGRSHLISFGEYAAMYLFAFSDVIWPPNLPTFEELFRIPGPQGSQPAPRDLSKAVRGSIVPVPNPVFTKSEAQRQAVASFQLSLPKVRRALANMPTYMIFDDHEVTDDWFLNRRFCEKIFATQLGPRIIQNGLAAFALFQAWGNVGNESRPGDVSPALTAFQAWQQAGFPASGSQFSDLGKLLGMPTAAPGPAPGTGVVQLSIDTNAVKYHYALSWGGHELIVVDSRTRRGYPAPGLKNPALIADSGQAAQVGIPLPAALEQKISIVVVPGPVNGGEPIAEQFQTMASRLAKEGLVFTLDVENWKFDRTAFESLLSTLATRGQRQRRYVILSGDVHYGFAHRVQYWASKPLTDPNGAAAAATFAMMTSSAFKNETSEPFFSATRTLHKRNFLTLDPNVRRMTTRVAFNRIASDPPTGRVTVGKSARKPWLLQAELDRSMACIDDLFIAGQEIDPGSTIADMRFSRQPTAIAIARLLRNELTRNTNPTPIPSKPPSLSQRLTVVINGVKETKKAYFDTLDPGSEVVGVNNVGFIRFEPRSNQGVNSLWAIQELRWRPGTPEDAYRAQRANPYRPADAVTQLAVDLTIEPAPTFPST